jgi:hypothetical protein
MFSGFVALYGPEPAGLGLTDPLIPNETSEVVWLFIFVLALQN